MFTFETAKAIYSRNIALNYSTRIYVVFLLLSRTISPYMMYYSKAFLVPLMNAQVLSFSYFDYFFTFFVLFQTSSFVTLSTQLIFQILL